MGHCSASNDCASVRVCIAAWAVPQGGFEYCSAECLNKSHSRQQTATLDSLEQQLEDAIDREELCQFGFSDS